MTQEPTSENKLGEISFDLGDLDIELFGLPAVCLLPCGPPSLETRLEKRDGIALFIGRQPSSRHRYLIPGHQ